MILIHTALLCEAQALIEYYKLKTIQKKKLYKNEQIVLYIGGVGYEATQTIDAIFQIYTPQKAFNIGIAGCNDTNIPIGSLVGVTDQIEGIKKLPLKTVKTAQLLNDEKKSTLYDMEGEFFLKIAQKYLRDADIYIFKVVSDYLDDTMLPKDMIKNMIAKKVKIIDEYIR